MKKLAVYLLAVLPALAAQSQSFIAEQAGPGSFPIVSASGKPAPIYVDPNDYWLVHKAAELLQQDIGKVTGHNPDRLKSLPAPGQNAILIGSIDGSKAIASLAPTRKLTGKWEA